MIRTAIALLFYVTSSSCTAATPQCADDAIAQAEKLLAFHFGEEDDRIEIDSEVQELPPMANPADEDQQFQVLEVWGSIYKGQYRMRFYYYPLGDDCVLMGQKILEHASL